MDQLNLTTPAFVAGANIPTKYTCKGENVSPSLSISGRPAGLKSLALIMHDPDAVSGDFTHWTLWNINPQTTQIAENSLPAGTAEGTTSFGKPGYGGPCPPAGTGTHRYMFELYALDLVLNLPITAQRPQLETAMQGHILAKAQLTGLFGQNPP